MLVNEPVSAPPKKGLAGLIAGIGCVWLAVIILVPIITCVLGTAGIVVAISGSLKSSEVYQLALQRAQSSPAVIETLGEPIEPGWWVMGTISTVGITGEAELRFPISGPRGSGTVSLYARRENGVWNFYSLGLVVNGTNQLIDLR